MNQGSLTGGFIGLVSPDIENAGEITARVGSIVFGASDLVTLTFSDSDLVSIAVKDADFAAAIKNTGALVAENGSIIMKASVAQSWVDELITKDVGSAELVSVNGVPQLVNIAGRARAKQ